ncbi:MAG: hypothetical protein FJ077_17010 [Cyanobacteria bacterium K_DeepCast_35m_m2_023]|nr:hypothetical protein [Cyanobacteria bacterium K_DeepCast_35m_m2_023]
MEFPKNPTSDQLAELERYLLSQKVGSQNIPKSAELYYQNKVELLSKKLIIFRHKQKKNNGWYVRFYLGNRKYKTLSLGTADQKTATERALDKGHLE